MFELDVRKLWLAWRAPICALMAAAAIGGCGGGGISAGVDTGGTGGEMPTYSYGPIDGFGSIIVNGVRFDDTLATVLDDDGATHSRSELKLGMVVAVDAGPIRTDASGVRTSTATKVQIGTEITGPVQAVDVAAGTLTVIGQTVSVDAQTVFDGLPNGLAGVQAGQLVEIHAFVDATLNRDAATRVERKGNLAAFKLRGRIANLNLIAKTFTIGAATVSFATVPAAQLPALSNGLLVRATLLAAQQGGIWVATKLRADVRNIADGTEAEIEGFVTDFVSLASFKINGIAVDASGSRVTFENGTAAQIANGVHLEVAGEARGGVVVARKVAFERDDEADKFELSGAIESIDAGTHTFVLRGVTVSYDDSTRFDGGTVAMLAVGARVEVSGKLSANGTQVLASRIEFKS